ncbi:MAG: SRPBCC domain-containing protein [Mycobacteriales bacterium]
MRTDFEVTEVYPHPVERVWAALTSADALAAWLMPNDFAAAEVGHEFTFTTDPAPGFDGIVRCRVAEVVPPERMVWEWRSGSMETTVTFTLTALGPDSTRFHLRHLGFVGLGAQLARMVMAEGSKRIYGRLLPAYLNGQPAADVDCVKEWDGSMTVLDRISLISVPVTDQQRARDYYVDVLGFAVKSDTELDGTRWVMLSPPGGGPDITLVTWFDNLPPGASHLSITTDDVDGAYAVLTARGVTPNNEPADAFWGRWFGFDDPDGNNWLVVEPAAAG